MIFKKSFLFLAFIITTISALAQEADSVKNQDNGKSGYNLGLLPAISFDSDLGFQYGLIANLFNYGDGSYYPDYKWSIYGEWSRTTKGSGTNQLFFDSKYLLPHELRVTADMSILTEKALDFYGFNGFEAAYFPQFENDEESNDAYISRMFYRHERKMFRLALDLQGELTGNLRWLAGYGRFDYQIGSVDIDKLNKGLDEEDKLPEVKTLYDEYREVGLISQEEADGGELNSLKIGLVYDSRDNEANPNHGIWAEGIVMTAPRFFFNDESAYTKLALVYRQYLPLISNKLTFAYRVGWQGTVSGNTPFYMQPFMVTTNIKITKNDGLGGAKSLRGILRNRIVGDAITYANFELRYKFFKFNKWNQNFYMSLSGFSDLGMVTKEININKSSVPLELYNRYFDAEKDKLHLSYGAGLQIAMNENFILAIDYGIAADKKDGDNGLYIGIGYIF